MHVISYEFAPLEGITDSYFRQIHASLFPDAVPDKYYAPFVSPTEDTPLTEKEYAHFAEEIRCPYTLIPQLLVNRPEPFIRAALLLAELGYREINLNLGCPSGTVVSKHKGSGFLEDPDELDRFFDGIFSLAELSDIRISVKTRLGLRDPVEFDEILPIYRKYPISELIIHPRVRTEMYKGTPHRDVFQRALPSSPFPVCYNGDIFTKSDFCSLSEALGDASVSLMLGRGLISDPMLISVLRDDAEPDKKRICEYTRAIFEDARSRLSGERHILNRMKEFWAYWTVLFDADEVRPYEKRIRKAQTLSEFSSAADAVFSACSLRPDAGFLGAGRLE